MTINPGKINVFQTRGRVYRLVASCWLMVFVICMMWLPVAFHVQNYDVHLAMYFTNLITHSKICSTLIRHLNHQYEPIINIALMLLCQILWCLHLTPSHRRHCGHQIMVCFFTVSIWLHAIIEPFASFTKFSPVLMMPHVHDTIVRVFGQDMVLGSLSCLASGHAFALFYSLFYFVHDRGSVLLKILMLMVAIFFSFHRVLIGEHWISDYFISILLAYACVQMVQATRIESWLIKGAEKMVAVLISGFKQS